VFVSVTREVYSVTAVCKGLFWMGIGKTACGNGLTRVDERGVTADEIIALLK
jgi:hypothetical protein